MKIKWDKNAYSVYVSPLGTVYSRLLSAFRISREKCVSLIFSLFFLFLLFSSSVSRLRLGCVIQIEHKKRKTFCFLLFHFYTVVWHYRCSHTFILLLLCFIIIFQRALIASIAYFFSVSLTLSLSLVSTFVISLAVECLGHVQMLSRTVNRVAALILLLQKTTKIKNKYINKWTRRGHRFEWLNVNLKFQPKRNVAF